MLEGTPKELSQYRLEAALSGLKAADRDIAAEDYRSCANRSYYAVFHTMRATMALEKVDFKKHSAVISYFQKEYIKTKIFEVKYSKLILDAFRIRNKSDYDDFYIVDKPAVREQLALAHEFYEIVFAYLQSKYEE